MRSGVFASSAREPWTRKCSSSPSWRSSASRTLVGILTCPSDGSLARTPASFSTALRRNVDVGGREVGRIGDRLAGLAEAFKVERDRVLHLTLDFPHGLACSHAAWE